MKIKIIEGTMTSCTLLVPTFVPETIQHRLNDQSYEEEAPTAIQHATTFTFILAYTCFVLPQII